MNDNQAAPEERAQRAGGKVVRIKPKRVDPKVFLSASYWLKRKIESPDQLLGELLTTTTRMIIGGATGLGKTHLGFALAAGIASGEGFLHWKAHKAARVLYLDGEMPSDLVQERITDLGKRHNWNALAPNLFALCSEDIEAVAAKNPKLGSPGPLNTAHGQAFLLQLIDLLGGVDVVILDNRMSLLTGDMKEEQPWTDTMPLVKEFTRRRIAQIWFDHMGHNAERIYGSSTTQWQLDVVATLKAVEDPSAELSFRMEFTKARRRRRSNWSDFEAVTITLRDDAWIGSKDGPAKPKSAIPAAKAGWLQDINEVFAEPGLAISQPPLLGMPVSLTLTRGQLRAHPRVRARLDAEPHATLTAAQRRQLADALRWLADHHFIGVSDDLVWLP